MRERSLSRSMGCLYTLEPPRPAKHPASEHHGARTNVGERGEDEVVAVMVKFSLWRGRTRGHWPYGHVGNKGYK